MTRGKKETEKTEEQEEDLKLNLQDVPAENIFSNSKIAHLMEKYGKANTYIPPDKKKLFRSEGFCIRFRLSKAYRGLEKQEVLTSRPEIEKITGRRKKQKMAELMRQLEAEMMLPDPDAVAKQKFLELQKLKLQRRKEEQREIEKAEAEAKKKATAEKQATVNASRRSLDPHRTQYMMEYWGQPSKKNTAERGDWRLKDKDPPNAGWWRKFVLKKPKITVTSRRQSSISVRSKVTPMKVLDTQKEKQIPEAPKSKKSEEERKQKKGYENVDYTISTDFFITNVDNTPYSAVEEWERRNTERKLNRMERAQKLKISRQTRNTTSKRKPNVVTIDEPEPGQDDSKALNTITEELEDIDEANEAEEEDNLLLRPDRRASICSMISQYSYIGELTPGNASSSSASSNSGSECSNSDIERFLDSNVAAAKDSRLKDNLKMLIKAKANSSGNPPKAGSVRSVSFRESSAAASLPGQANDFEHEHATAVKISFNGDNRHKTSTSSEASNESPPKKSTKLSRTKSAPASSKPNKEVGHQLDDLGRPLKTYRCLYTLCNCQHVGKKNTLAKLQHKKRKEVGVITIFGCPPDGQQESSSSVCPFCNVFPRKRIQAWLTQVEKAM